MRCAIAFIVGVSLLACGPKAVSWRPASSMASEQQIAKRAVRIEEGDLETVRDAGGATAGTLTYRSGEYSVETLAEYAAEEAAEHGGTHYMLGGASESDGPSTYTGVKGVGDTWVVREHRNTVRTVQILVLRVPRAGWNNLPRALTPESNE